MTRITSPTKTPALPDTPAPVDPPISTGAPEPIDTLAQFETPEGVVLTMSVAGPVPRALAWLIDAVIRYTVVLAIAMATSLLGRFGGGVFLLTLFVVEWFYPVVFEVLSGATPGKRRMGLVVVHEDGTPLTWSSALVRNLLRAVDFMPVFYGVGLVTMLLHPQFKRLGDLAAGTLVIHVPATPQRPALPESEARLPPLPLSVEEQQAILDYAERSDQLSPGRAQELACHLTGVNNEQAREQVIQYANGLAGSKGTA